MITTFVAKIARSAGGALLLTLRDIRRISPSRWRIVTAGSPWAACIPRHCGSGSDSSTPHKPRPRRCRISSCFSPRRITMPSPSSRARPLSGCRSANRPRPPHDSFRAPAHHPRGPGVGGGATCATATTRIFCGTLFWKLYRQDGGSGSFPFPAATRPMPWSRMISRR